MKFGKIKPMELGKTIVGAAAGAYVGEMVSEKVVEMVDSDMAETGALLAIAAVGAYVEDSQKGFIGSVGAGLAAEAGKNIIKKYVGGGSDAGAASSTIKPAQAAVKGVEAEIGEIYDEISKALEVRGANDPVITGANDPIITGWDEIGEIEGNYEVEGTEEF